MDALFHSVAENGKNMIHPVLSGNLDDGIVTIY